MKKTVQYFTKEYLELCAGLTPDQIIEFLENYRSLVAKVPEKCQPISLKIEPSLLKTFKQKGNSLSNESETVNEGMDNKG